MINVIQTLKNLNKEFPRYQLDTLIKIVECVVEQPEKSTYIPWDKNITWYNTPITCSQYKADPEDLGFTYTTCTKNHAADKTSSKQNITTEEDINFFKELKEML